MAQCQKYVSGSEVEHIVVEVLESKGVNIPVPHSSSSMIKVEHQENNDDDAMQSMIATYCSSAPGSASEARPLMCSIAVAWWELFENRSDYDNYKH